MLFIFVSIQSEKRGEEEHKGEVVVVVTVVILVVCQSITEGDVVDCSSIVAVVVFSVFSIACSWLFVFGCFKLYTNKKNGGVVVRYFFCARPNFTHRSNFPVQLYHESNFLNLNINIYAR